jgi:hypothetical protein
MTHKNIGGKVKYWRNRVFRRQYIRRLLAAKNTVFIPIFYFFIGHSKLFARIWRPLLLNQTEPKTVFRQALKPKIS